ncbi:MAG: PBP1A family penicillin-binding protein [Candidatus Moranbacteria bacterium]|nr:PBP1A family penicillin-binding protein [Candidatus Moranbacteria bacterium]
MPRFPAHILKQLALGIFDALLIVSGGLILSFILVYRYAAPPAANLADRPVAETSIIYDRTGTHELYRIHGEENRRIISHDQIPDVMREATVAIEDSSFYSHPGVNIFSMFRALRTNLQHNDIRQGGSTITQQLVRAVFLSREKTLKRKFLEAIIAIKMERHYSKDQILDMYLNEIPYGSNAYGVESATLTYFGKSAKDLTLPEAAFLAALPKATTYYSPYNTHQDELKARQQDVIRKMNKLGMIDSAQVESALSVDVLAEVRPLSEPIIAPHFVFYVIDQLEQKYGTGFLETGGLRVTTSIDLDLQSKAEEVVRAGVERNYAYGASNAALSAVDPRTGDVLAMVGSKDFFDKKNDGEVNVTTSERQPGSSFKPFAYARAFELGYQPETLILDAPTDFGPDGSGRDYVPRNYDGKFHGLLTMRQALSQSLNIPAIKTLYLAGIDATIDLAHRMGITTLNDRKRYGLSLVIGGGEVKPLDMAAAFSVFANDGVRNPVRPILGITDSAGNIVFDPGLNPERVMDAEIARKIDSVLSDNDARAPIFGKNSPLNFGTQTVAAKTGTTQEFRDAWTIGFSPSIAVSVWTGNNDNRPMKGGADGVFVAAPIWRAFMDKFLAGKPEEHFIAYETSKLKSSSQGLQFEKKVTYYNNKTGKKISESKAKKTDPAKVDQKIEFVPKNGSSPSAPAGDIQTSYAVPNPTDPMFGRWGGYSLTVPKK